MLLKSHREPCSLHFSQPSPLKVASAVSVTDFSEGVKANLWYPQPCNEAKQEQKPLASLLPDNGYLKGLHLLKEDAVKFPGPYILKKDSFQNIWITTACLPFTNKQVILFQGPDADFHMNGNILIIGCIVISYLQWLNKNTHQQVLLSYWKQQHPPVSQKDIDNHHNKNLTAFP